MNSFQFNFRIIIGLTMNVLLTLFICHSIFHIDVEGGDNPNEQCVDTPKNHPSFVLHRENFDLKLAVPIKVEYFQNEKQTCYSTAQELISFCPPNEQQLYELCENNPKCQDEKNILFPTTFHGDSAVFTCQSEIRPTVTLTTNINSCFVSGEINYGREYQVGYTVWNNMNKEARHISIYNVCHFEETGTLYTSHTITPLTSNNVHDYKELKSEYIIESDLGKNKSNTKVSIRRTNYQFVNSEDMPVDSWVPPTTFDFNILPVAGTKVLTQLQMVDDIIRMSVFKLQKSVKVHTGKLQLTSSTLERHKDKIKLKLNKHHHLDHLCKIVHSDHLRRILHSAEALLGLESTFVWKILEHDTEGAIAIITQTEPSNKCVPICENQADHETWPEFMEPSVKRCTYACEVSERMIKEFGLSHFMRPIPNILNIKYLATKSLKNDKHSKESKESKIDEDPGESKAVKNDKHADESKDSSEHTHKSEKNSHGHLWTSLVHRRQKRGGENKQGKNEENREEEEEEEGRESNSSSSGSSGEGNNNEGGEETGGGGGGGETEGGGGGEMEGGGGGEGEIDIAELGCGVVSFFLDLL